MDITKLTNNPTVYGIISQSPLFKVAFPEAIIPSQFYKPYDISKDKDALNVDGSSKCTSYDKDNGKDETTTAVNNPHCELYPNGSVME